MKPSRRSFLLSSVSLALVPAALAQDAYAASITAQLRSQGFQIVRARRTLLGRMRIVAVRGGLTREIVYDPRNGVILRDYTSGDEDDEFDDEEFDDEEEDDEEDEDEDEDEDDEDEDGEDDGEDNSGSGSGDEDDGEDNSGSGSGDESDDESGR